MKQQERKGPLWAPWRIEYILQEKDDECIFCVKREEKQFEDELILYRGNLTMVVMNLYPYTNGHLLVAPLRHIANFEELTRDEVDDVGIKLQKAVDVLKKTMRPEGFNIGMNLGRVAGAGVEEHLHFHIVPRWLGDINFMPIMSGATVIPEHLKVTYYKLKELFKDF
ncbi:MAG: HIT domain-containing protein [Thermodesulfobacteriota bacterium]|nr:HIT domain-containing protein [Thermodesulfobacteriota bacterium]